MNTLTDETATEATTKTRFGKTFLVLLALGVPGMLTLIPMTLDQLDALPPEMLELSVPLTVALSLLTPLILLAIAVAVGTLLAHAATHVGFLVVNVAVAALSLA